LDSHFVPKLKPWSCERSSVLRVGGLGLLVLGVVHIEAGERCGLASEVGLVAL